MHSADPRFIVRFKPFQFLNQFLNFHINFHLARADSSPNERFNFS